MVVHVLLAPWDKPVHMVLFTVVALCAGWLIGIRRAQDLWLCFGVTVLVAPRGLTPLIRWLGYWL